MHLIDTGNAATGAYGAPLNEFDDGDPAQPRLGTVIDSAILNAFMMEIANTITNAGIALVKGTNTQLRDAVVNVLTNQTIDGVKTWIGRQILNVANALPALSIAQTGAGSAMYASSMDGTNPTLDLANGGGGPVAALTNSSGTNPTLNVRNNNGSMAGNAINVEVGTIRLASNPADADGHTNQLSALALPKGWAHFAWNNGAPTLVNGMNMAAPGNPAAGQIQINLTAGIGFGAMVVTGLAGPGQGYKIVPQNLTGLIKIEDQAGAAVAFGSTTGFAFVHIDGKQ